MTLEMMLINRGLEEGRRESFEVGRRERLREAILSVLADRFGQQPLGAISEQLESRHSLADLRGLIRMACTSPSFDEFADALSRR